MIILSPRMTAEPVDCPYLPDRKFVQEYFFASGMNEPEFNTFLEEGWRRFGLFFFRPQCERCSECRPIRVSCTEFVMSKSQRRIARKNAETKVIFRDIHEMVESDDPEVPLLILKSFDIFRKHSSVKFGRDKEDFTHFLESFFQPAVPALQSEYYIRGRLAAVGYIDCSDKAFSSVYFFYDPAYSSYGLGNFSVIKEIDEARKRGLKWYNLGYYIKDCSRMVYKGRFHPHALYDWSSGKWISESSVEMADEIDIQQ